MPIKLLLLEDVEELGRSGDIVTVKPGYARNYLLPQGFGVIADANALRMQTRLRDERIKKAIEDKKESEDLAGRLTDIVIEKTVKVDHEGHMYGSVSALDIVHLLQEQVSIVVERRSIQLKHPIKQTGVFTINLKLKEGVTSSIKLKVVPEEIHGKAPVVQNEEAVPAE